MRVYSWRARSQGSTLSFGRGSAFWGALALALAAVLGAGGCKNSEPSHEDGGQKDTNASDAPRGSDALQPGVCPPGTVSKSKGRAESCSCNDECQTGFFCADGVCCTSACGQTCRACNLATSLGVCAPVPSGVKPHDSLVCAASKPATCGQDGTCDGKGGCRKYVEGTECKLGTCDGDSVTGIVACDGKGNCSEAASSLICPPYTCDPATSHCTYTCTSNSQCAAGQQCVAGRCGKSPNAAVCQSSDDCVSGFCAGASADVLGVCCNIGCNGPCESCSQTGSLGTCTYLPVGFTDPACNGTDRTTCGNNGLCDGLGSCTRWSENTQCGSSACSGLVENTPRTCDGQGNCRDPQLVDCFPFVCSNGACLQNCTSDQDCAPENQCQPQTLSGVSTNTCGQKQNGQPCSDSGECISGQCVDKVCCESACIGPCRSCDLPSSPGHCLSVASGASDPRNTCKDLGATSCSTNGLCDGNGGCQAYPTGTACASQTCVSGVYSPPSTCNASGQCVPSPSRPCDPYVCNGSTCYDTCTSNNAQCVPGNVCTNASCGLKPNGANCGVGTECKSAFCAQGVCCNSACSDACMACNLPSTPGFCVAVADNAPDPQGKCAATPPDACGTTGTCVKGACSYWSGNCKPSVCANTSSVTPASTCDGKGACITPSNQPCGSFACVNGGCNTTCTVATQAQDCVSPNTCVTISGVLSCGLKVDGAACTAAGQCQSGFCTEGACCNSACSDDQTTGGLCKTCKATGTTAAGTCHNVPSGGSDPKSRCANSKSDPQSKTAATPAPATEAAPASHGQTPPPAGRRYAPSEETSLLAKSFATVRVRAQTSQTTTGLSATPICAVRVRACLTTCQTTTDCMTPNACVSVPSHHCGEHSGSSGCTAGTDCASGHCVDSVCCNSACADGCQSCTLSGSVGTCSDIASGSSPRTTTPATCPAAEGTGVCGNTGKCDGKRRLRAAHDLYSDRVRDADFRVHHVYDRHNKQHLHRFDPSLRYGVPVHIREMCHDLYHQLGVRYCQRLWLYWGILRQGAPGRYVHRRQTMF